MAPTGIRPLIPQISLVMQTVLPLFGWSGIYKGGLVLVRCKVLWSGILAGPVHKRSIGISIKISDKHILFIRNINF